MSSPASATPVLSPPVPLAPGPAVQPAVQPAIQPAAPRAATTQPAAATPRGDTPPQETVEAVPHIALLLPLNSKPFARHAEAVRDGVLAAARVQAGGAPRVQTYALGDNAEETVNAYIKALAAGARVVVGPLTRNGVTAVLGSAAVLVPTLVLNVPEGSSTLPPEIYLFSLQVEAEARQVAQLAYQDGMRRAVTLNGDTPLLKRIHQAFVEEFTRLGGTHAATHAFTSDPEGLTRMKRALGAGGVDMAFLALDFPRAQLARPYFGAMPVYATSQVHPGNAGPLAGFDLAGVRFLDMPWLLQPDHAAVMSYPRPAHGGSVELDRFYALGIDAYRIALTLLAGKAGGELDGVTGRITLGRDQQFARALTAAQFNDGKLVVTAPRQ